MTLVWHWSFVPQTVRFLQKVSSWPLARVCSRRGQDRRRRQLQTQRRVSGAPGTPRPSTEDVSIGLSPEENKAKRGDSYAARRYTVLDFSTRNRVS
jgi:hypothetical protein